MLPVARRVVNLYSLEVNPHVSVIIIRRIKATFQWVGLLKTNRTPLLNGSN
jgi:hypothetical protein